MEPSPPGPARTLAELRARFDALPRAGARAGLGRRAAAVLLDMFDNPRLAAVCSISELAGRNGVNASTLTRAAQTLGYRGFGELQDVFRQHVAGQGHFYSDHADRMLQAQAQVADDVAVIQRLAREEIANVEATVADLARDHAQRAAAALAGARRVHILALRQCFSLAHFFAYALGLIRPDVTVLGNAGHVLAEDLAALGARDVLLVITFKPYTRETVSACRCAGARGSRLIVVTDSWASPLAADGDPCFIVAAEGAFFFNAMAAAVVLLESLLVQVAGVLGERAIEALREREALFEELQTEAGQAGRG